MEFLIHSNICFLRKKHGWTQTQLATHLGIKRSMVAAYEQYRTVPLLPMTMKMADLFHVDLDSLTRKDLEKENKKEAINRNEDKLSVR